PGLDRPGAHRPPAPGAHRAGIVDHQPAAPAGPARLGESEAAQGLPGPPRPGRRGGALGPEPPPEQVTKPAAGAGVRSGSRSAEQVAEVEAAEPALGSATGRRPETAAEEGTGLVVLLAPLLVGQHGVCLGDLLEALLRRRIALVRVRVVLTGELAVRLLDLVWGRGLGDTQDLVIVLLEVVLGAHWFLLGVIRFLLSSSAVRAGRACPRLARRARLQPSGPGRSRRHQAPRPPPWPAGGSGRPPGSRAAGSGRRL